MSLIVLSTCVLILYHQHKLTQGTADLRDYHHPKMKKSEQAYKQTIIHK